MTHARSATLLILSSVLACASPAFADEPATGVTSMSISKLKYRSASTSAKWLGKRLKDGLKSRLQGATKARRVTFDYEDELSGETFSVRGFVLGWKNLRVERYRITGVSEAILFSTHEREDEDETALIEARRRQIIVISGEGANDAKLVAKVRELIWPHTGDERVDVLGLRKSADDVYFHYSDWALDNSPALMKKLEEHGGTFEMIRDMDPRAVYGAKGDAKRLETQGGIFTVDYNSMGVYTTEKQEDAFRDYMIALGHTPKSVVNDARGLAGGLD